MSEDAAVNNNLTFDDVVGALGETDPNSTNAAKLRTVLGRGGLTTIQKHLDAIRAARAVALLPVEDVRAPAMPDSVAAMWGGAYGTAMAMVRTRMDSVVQERDALTTKLAAAGQDREAWEAEVKGTAAHAASVDAKLAEAMAAAETTAAAAAAVLKLTQDAAEATESRLSAEVAEARHLVQVTELKAQNGAQAMQVTIDRLTDQVGELKSLLHIATRPEAVAKS